MAYCAVAALIDVNLQFAALLAGYGIVGGIQGTERERFAVPLESIAKVSFGVFVPIYFGIVGYRLVFGREFSMAVLLIFFFASSAISIFSSALAARAGGFRGLDVVNIAVTTNARGGPGIVLASVAYDSGIINAAFYTALVITAVVTSQACGTWLRYILSKGLPLLSSNPEETWQTEPAKEGGLSIDRAGGMRGENPVLARRSVDAVERGAREEGAFREQLVLDCAPSFAIALFRQ